MPTLETVNISPQMRDFDKLCSSNDLSLISLQEKFNLLSASDIKHISYTGSCLHKVCMNENVTLEIIEYLLDIFPRAVSNGRATILSSDSEVEKGKVNIEAYPLHCACYNEDCPSSVIKLLLDAYPSVLQYVCKGQGMNNYNRPGLPLHYYLARNCNVDIDTVKMMVETYPASLTISSDEEYLCFPIHALLDNWEHIIPNDLLEIITLFYDSEPLSLRVMDEYNSTPLRLACHKNINLELVKLLYNSWPEAIRLGDDHGWLPLYGICTNSKLDDTNSLDILRFMLDVDPSLSRDREEEYGYLPIHYAVCNMSFEFCKVLIDAYPESLRVGTSDGRDSLPIHMACGSACRGDVVDTIQYMLDLDSDLITARNEDRYLPIHCAAHFGKSKVIEFLLGHDPDAASKKTDDGYHHLPLHVACMHGSEAVVRILYDDYPEAIFKLDGDNNTPFDRRRTPIDHAVRNRSNKTSIGIMNFLQNQRVYIGHSDSDIQHLASRMELNDNGWTLLHRALQEEAPLGSIKLLAKGAPAIVRTANNQFAFPLHFACEFSSAKVVQYLVGESNKHILARLDENKESVLHYACRGGNLEVIKYLLTNHAPLVASAEVNEKGELPIHLLCEAGKKARVDIDSAEYAVTIWSLVASAEVNQKRKLPLHLLCDAGKGKVDSESAEYIETIWLMLLANPEALVGA